MPIAHNRSSFLARPCVLPHVLAVEAYSHLSFARHTHDSYGIGRIVSGAQRSLSGRGQVEAGQGDVITVNPGEVHDGTPIGDARAWKMLYFSPDAISSMAKDIGDGAARDFEFYNPVMVGNIQASAFEAAYDTLVGPHADAARAEEQLMLFLAELFQAKPRSHAPDNAGIARAKACIDVADLSRFQAVRGFAKLTGLTPHAYVVQKRLDAARHLIGRGISLADAAVACGFADQSHFTRAFVRRYGLTPGSYAAAMH
jgi:AraC-like DNA-binding protein